MAFLNGLEALIAGLAAAAAVVALYFLKLKRRELVISSTLLWRRSLNDLAVNSPFQRLRAGLLLFLQLFVLFAAALALARPAINRRGAVGGDVILLLDVSSSMNTREGSATRLDLAKKAAKGIIRRMDKNNSMMILTFAGECSVQKSFTRSKTDLQRAVDAVPPGEGPTDLEDALSVAISMAKSRGIAANSNERQSIVIVSDGGFADPAGLEVEGHITSTGIRIFTAERSADQEDMKRSFEIPLRFVSVGRTSRNVAITRIDVRKLPGGGAQILVNAENFSPDPVETSLTLRNRGPDGTADDLLSAVAISLGAAGSDNARSGRLFDVPELTDTIIEFSLDIDDDLPADNRAWVPLRAPRPPSVLLVTTGNFFLEKALKPDAANPCRFSTIAPADYPPDTAFDVTVFDRWAPAELPPGSYLFFGADPPIEGVKPRGDVGPVLIDWDRAHALNRFVDFSGIQIVRACNYELPPYASVLVEGDACPLAFAISDAGRHVVCVAFPLFDKEDRLNTTWPYRVSFPVFISNAINWLNPDARGTAKALVQVGSPISFTLPADANAAVITDPHGGVHRVEADANRRVVFNRTTLPGPYRVQVEGKDDTWFAANLLSSAESNIAPRASFEWRNSEISSTDATVETTREMWRYFVTLALVALVAEWYVYHRKGR